MADTRAYPRGNDYSFGIDENTALVVTGPWMNEAGGRSGEVLGESGVTIFDMTEAKVCFVDESNGWRMDGLKVSHISRGDTVDLQNYNVVPASFKSALEVRALLSLSFR